MAASVSERVRKRRDALRDAGLRPVQIWVPDSRLPGFADSCRRQARLVAASDAEDRELMGFLDGGLADLTGEDGA